MKMVERVARVLEPQAWASLDKPGAASLAYENRRKSSLRKARAAIEALRTLTPPILPRLIELRDSPELAADDMWEAMINAILTE